ncbi:MAG TPA: hypothetical protein VKB38_00930 [Terracidiphilus sp.]|nr:hypothetical protein [Terracidiphilus sp.]
MPRKRQISIPIVFLALLAGCTGLRNPESLIVQKNLIHQAEKCRGNATCFISVKSATPFDWDEMYFFDVGSSRSEREHAVGIKGVEVSDLEGELVFTRSGRITHQEPVRTGVEEPLKNEISFSGLPATGGILKFASSARFEVQQESSKNGPYFILKSAQ